MIPTAARRRAAVRIGARLAVWLAARTDPTAHHSIEDLSAVTGVSVRDTARALRDLGWSRVAWRPPRCAPTYRWVPPGAPDPRRPVGRPKGSTNRKAPSRTTQQEATHA